MDKKEFIKLMELLAGIPPEELYDRIFGVDPDIKLMELLASLPPEELYNRIFGVDPEEDDGK